MKIIERRYFSRYELKELCWNPNSEWRARARRILANNGKPHLYWSWYSKGYYEARLREV